LLLIFRRDSFRKRIHARLSSKGPGGLCIFSIHCDAFKWLMGRGEEFFERKKECWCCAGRNHSLQRMAMYRYHGEKISVREIFTSTMLLIEILLLLLINLIFNFFSFIKYLFFFKIDSENNYSYLLLEYHKILLY